MKIIRYFTALMIVAVLFTGGRAYADNTAEEYDYWAHHKYTPYQYSASPLPKDEKTYLANLFVLTELAMKNRIDAQRFLGSGQDQLVLHEFNYKYQRLVEAFGSLEAPRKASRAQYMIVEAMTEQHEYINEWGNAGPDKSEEYRKNFYSHPKVQSSHKNLVGAYNQLMRAFPTETKNNQQAFFDFLCAMDFI